jgi:diadenosine tetraphosphate (Ap4A) HIT family hydrolase
MAEKTEVACPPTYEDICTFCHEVSGDDNIFYRYGIAEGPGDYVLHQSANFIVVPSLGALTDWYVLIVPRRHVLSTGWLSPDERTELRAVSEDVISKVARRSGQNVVLFEHGSYSFRDKGGACHDHAHIHVVATEKPVSSFVDAVSADVELPPCEDWIEGAAGVVAESGRSYLALWTPDGSRIGVANDAPSGFFRKSLAAWLGADPAEHDWLVFPQIERLRAMVRGGL